MSKFVINKGMSNEFIITIKQDGTTLPMVIVDGDTFVAELRLLKDSSVVATITATVEDANNGKIKIAIPAEVVNTLPLSLGDRADYYYSNPTHKLVISCSTANNGSFIAKVSKVYVE